MSLVQMTLYEVIFNSMLRSARNQVECAFGRLKARWAILTRKIDVHVPDQTYSTDGSEELVVRRLLTDLI